MSADARLTDLEMKLTWMEQHIFEQDKVILHLREEVEFLQARVRDLHDMDTPAKPLDPRADIPPHY